MIIRVSVTPRESITDIDGVFKIEASAKDKLTITFIGYLDAVVSAANTVLKVTLRKIARHWKK